MKNIDIDRRRYPRYDTEMGVYFKVKYDIKTRVKFQVMASRHEDNIPHKYFGLCRNVSVEGLCFDSNKKLDKGDILMLEVFEPSVKNPIEMEGEVRWSKKCSGEVNGEKKFRTGVHLISVNDKLIADSIYFDKKYKVAWSAVLDSLFGTFAAMKK